MLIHLNDPVVRSFGSEDCLLTRQRHRIDDMPDHRRFTGKLSNLCVDEVQAENRPSLHLPRRPSLPSLQFQWN